MIYPIEPRTRDRLASRFRAGDSVELLAEDYGISPEQVEAALREEWTPLLTIADAVRTALQIRDLIAELEHEKESSRVCDFLRTARIYLADAAVHLNGANRADKEGR